MRSSRMILGRFLRSYLIALVALPVLASNVDAMAIRWFLYLVRFDDGAAARGSFVYEAYTNTYSSIRITTTAGRLPGETYHDLSPGLGGENLGFG